MTFTLQSQVASLSDVDRHNANKFLAPKASFDDVTADTDLDNSRPKARLRPRNPKSVMFKDC